jgi:ABC-2 type transport system ATP-binding protein
VTGSKPRKLAESPSIVMLLQTEHLTKDYGRFRALDDFNLTVGEGEIFGLLGPNGSGKSTAIRLLLGFLQPTRGRAMIAGHDCWHDSVGARQHVVYLPGELRLYENMTGRQLLHFLGRLRSHLFHDDTESLARRLDIDLDRPIVQLSSGMKRKLALLQVLVPRAPLLILDEPTNTLDPTMRDELLAQLRKARDRGQAVLFSSHVLSEVEQVCDRVGILQRGRLVHLQTMNELRQMSLVQARFLGSKTGVTEKGETWRPSLDGLSELPGLQVREQDRDRLTLEFSGQLPVLLDWLARQPLAELRIEPLGLGAIYHRYHGVES